MQKVQWHFKSTIWWKSWNWKSAGLHFSYIFNFSPAERFERWSINKVIRQNVNKLLICASCAGNILNIGLSGWNDIRILEHQNINESLAGLHFWCLPWQTISLISLAQWGKKTDAQKCPDISFSPFTLSVAWGNA